MLCNYVMETECIVHCNSVRGVLCFVAGHESLQQDHSVAGFRITELHWEVQQAPDGDEKELRRHMHTRYCSKFCPLRSAYV